VSDMDIVGPGEHEAIHGWFGLTYANYLVLPRTLLQSMPDVWQVKFVHLLREMDEAFEHVPQADAYKVGAAVEREVDSLSDAEMKLLGISKDDCGHGDEDCDCSPTWSSPDRSEMESWERVLLPCADPVPHYDRGRERVEPRLRGPAGADTPDDAVAAERDRIRHAILDCVTCGQYHPPASKSDHVYMPGYLAHGASLSALLADPA